jgi:hypothetical protein
MLKHFNILTQKNGVRGALQKFYESPRQNPDASVAAEGARALVGAFEGGRERETEAHRLSLHQSSLQSLSGGQGSVHGLLCVAERRATRPNGEWGYSTRRHMLGPERPEAVSPGRGVVLTDHQSSVDCQ